MYHLKLTLTTGSGPEERSCTLQQGCMDQDLQSTVQALYRRAMDTLGGTSQPNAATYGPSQPPRPSGTGCGGPKLITAAQVRYLKQLLGGDTARIDHLLDAHGVRTLEDLSSRAASSAIDSLKGEPVR